MIANSIWQHVKTKGLYQFVDRAMIEATMTPAIVYRSLDHGNLWIRPESEFMDGRFRQVKIVADPKTAKTPGPT